MKKLIAHKVSQFLQASGETLVSIEKTFVGSPAVPAELKIQESKK